MCCMLVRVAPNTEFPFEWFQDCYRKNPDGFSIAYVMDRRVVIHKDLFKTPKEVYAFWQQHAPTGIEYAIHWRWRTHGTIDIARVHPHRVNEDLWIMHNGILDGMKDPDKNKSDTQIFAETIAAGLGDQVFNPQVAKLMGQAIGYGNRFIFLHSTLGMITINEDTGVTTARFPGCWFSNLYAWTPKKWGVKSDLLDDDGYVQTDFRGRVFSATEVETLQTNIEKLCVSIHSHAKEMLRYEQAATRFLNKFATSQEFGEHLHDNYSNTYDLYDDLTSAWQYLEAGHISFQDVLDWFNIHEGDEADDASYVG